MQVAISDANLPVRLRFAAAVTDAALMDFCALNAGARVERDAEGGLIVMSPVEMEGGGTEIDVAAELLIWARADGVGGPLAQIPGSS